MTDIAASSAAGRISKEEASARRARQRRKRFASEARFKYLGLGAVLLAGSFLVLLLSTVIGQGLPAFTYHYAKLPVDLTSVEADDPAAGDYTAIFRKSVGRVFPSMTARRDARVARAVFSSGAPIELRREVIDDPSLAGKRREIALPVSDFADLYLKGLTAKSVQLAGSAELQLAENGGTVSATISAPLLATFLADVKEVLGEIDALLARAGTDKSKILRAEIFIKDLQDFEAMNRVWDAWVPEGNAPPRATVQANLARPAWLIEIVVTAAV